MALVSKIVETIAEVGAMQLGTVELAARYAREAGYISQGARGRNAPRATVSDCVNLLIAVYGGGCAVKDAPKAIEMFRSLEMGRPHGSGRETIRGVEYAGINAEGFQFLNRKNALFGEILESIMERLINGELETIINTAVRKNIGDETFKTLAKDHAERFSGDVIKSTSEAYKFLIEKQAVVGFWVEFYRPDPFARILVDQRSELGEGRALIAGANFSENLDDIFSFLHRRSTRGDRSDRATFGYRTLIAIAEAMR
jgi:hypothetical protein